MIWNFLLPTLLRIKLNLGWQIW